MVNSKEKLLFVTVHGQYSAWSGWSECSNTCGDGISFRTRSCDSPEPANGGRQCSGMAKETKPCRIQDCPGKPTIKLLSNICRTYVHARRMTPKEEACRSDFPYRVICPEYRNCGWAMESNRLLYYCLHFL